MVFRLASSIRVPLSSFFSRVVPSWSTGSFERRAGIKSRAVIMNDSRGEREDIIVIDGREGRSRGWLPFNLEANPFVHLLPLLPGRHRAMRRGAARRGAILLPPMYLCGEKLGYLVHLVPLKARTETVIETIFCGNFMARGWKIIKFIFMSLCYLIIVIHEEGDKSWN